jgi:hypothetical protein
MGIAAALGTMPWKGARLMCIGDLDNPIWLKVLRKKQVEGAAPIQEHSINLNIIDDRVLLIRKIFFSIQVFHGYLLFRHT